MNQEILDFINGQHICVLASQMADGVPHAAALHFANTPDASAFFFMTSPNSKKAEFAKNAESTNASLVIGFDPEAMKTFQADGELRKVSESEMESYRNNFIARYPSRESNLDKSLALVFIPKWWRYSDMKNPQGKITIDSDSQPS